jgi:hypothetical protein
VGRMTHPKTKPKNQRLMSSWLKQREWQLWSEDIQRAVSLLHRGAGCL